MDSDKIFLNQYKNHFLRIDEELSRNFSTQVDFIKDIGNHSLFGKGKRLRPLLFLLSGQLCGYKGEDIYYYSTIFEFIHTASLLHDDVLDKAETRRKKPSVNYIWGNSAAVLGGDFLYSKSLGIALSCHNMQFLELLADVSTKMAEGQVLELVHTYNWDIGKDEYMEIIISKTAMLISAACACGAIISGAEKWVVDNLSQFGLNLGIAFQLMDDLLDYTSSEEDIGKPVGKDLREGKITLPLIYTLADLERAEIEWLDDIFQNDRASDDDYGRIIKMVRNNGVVDRVRAEARFYVDKAASFLDPFPDSAHKKELTELNSYIVKRSF